jgi:hypothetical protein
MENPNKDEYTITRNIIEFKHKESSFIILYLLSVCFFNILIFLCISMVCYFYLFMEYDVLD